MSAHVQDLMACAGAKGLGTINNKSRKSGDLNYELNNGLIKPLCRPCRVSPAGVLLINLIKPTHWALDVHCTPKNNRMDVNKVQNLA